MKDQAMVKMPQSYGSQKVQKVLRMHRSSHSLTKPMAKRNHRRLHSWAHTPLHMMQLLFLPLDVDWPSDLPDQLKCYRKPPGPGPLGLALSTHSSLLLFDHQRKRQRSTL